VLGSLSTTVPTNVAITGSIEAVTDATDGDTYLRPRVYRKYGNAVVITAINTSHKREDWFKAIMPSISFGLLVKKVNREEHKKV
jgi:hypothetical protein